jgi:peptide subunit release factor 1 (eRF1)
LSHQASESLRADLAKIDHFVAEEFRRIDANGLAMFSCAARDFWEVAQLPNAVGSHVVFGPRPYLTPLATFLSHNKPTAILLTDRKRARIITMQGNDVKVWAELQDRIIERSKAGQARYQRHADQWAKHHVDHAAELVLRLEQASPFDWLILGVEIEVESDLMKDLHPYVKDRVVGTIRVRIDAPMAEVVDKARGVLDQVEAQLIHNLMRQIQDYAAAGGRGTIGLATTLDALNEQKVHILLVQESYAQAGYECPNCGLLIVEQTGAPPVACPACNAPVWRVENVVDSAIQRAFELGSNVEVATEQNELAPIGCIGSITYY